MIIKIKNISKTEISKQLDTSIKLILKNIKI